MDALLHLLNVITLAGWLSVVDQTFTRGGWVMWPVLLVFFLALCVLLDRLMWWLQLKRSLRPGAQEEAREALGSGDFGAAWGAGAGSGDPFLFATRNARARRGIGRW